MNVLIQSRKTNSSSTSHQTDGKIITTMWMIEKMSCDFHSRRKEDGETNVEIKALFFSWVNPYLLTSTHFNLLQPILTYFNPLGKNTNFNPLQPTSTYFNQFQPTPS